MSEGGIILIPMARHCSFEHTEPHKCDNPACIWRRIALRPHQSCRLYDDVPDRAFDGSKACDSLLSSMIGMDPIISLFRSYQKLSSGMRLQGIDPRPFNPFAFVFKGPPGTGKTTTARICGDIFYEMGFLSTSEVIDCSATNLIGEYVGQTGPKVIIFWSGLWARYYSRRSLSASGNVQIGRAHV